MDPREGEVTRCYPSGQVAVLVNRVDGQLFSYFYDDDLAHTLLANFTSEGVGFAYYKDGLPRFVATKSGGMVCSPTDGSAVEQCKEPPLSVRSVVGCCMVSHGSSCGRQGNGNPALGCRADLPNPCPSS